MSETETAILAGGCFWPAEDLLSRRPGVLATRVGYTGGENENPTVAHHPGHAEAVEVVFDPAATTYRDIVDFFLKIHRADLGPDRVGSDYRSEIFYASQRQRADAVGAIADLDAAELWPGKAVTRVTAADVFWPAPDDDQRYLARLP